MTGSAAIEDHDPNGDGQFTVGDAVYISQYLYGALVPANINQLDVDDSSVVSRVDYLKVLAYDANSISTSMMDIFMDEINSVNSGVQSSSYVVYNAQNGNYKRSYTLTITQDDNTAGTNNIIGTDDRYENWSNRGVAKIMGTNNYNSTNIGYRGTGFVVGKHIIATSAYNVFNTVNDEAYNLSGILLFDADETWHSFTPKEIHIPLAYKNAPYSSLLCDYALITVEEDLSDYMSFNLGVATQNAGTNSLSITSAGFPYQITNQSGNTQTINNAYTHEERICSGNLTAAYNDYALFNADTSYGDLGGPIYTTETYGGITYYTVVGINSGAYQNYNSCVRIKSTLLKFYNGNSSNIQY